MIKYKRKLNVIAADQPEPIRLGQYDDDVALEFELYSSEGILTIDPDTAVAIRGIKPDGNGISVEGVLKCTQDKRTRQNVYTALVDVTKQMTACAGECRYKLVMTRGGKELNTCSFIVIIDRTTLDKDVIPSESEIREIVETLDRTDDLLKASRSITKAKKDIEEAVQTVQSAKDDVATAVDAVTALKMEILALKDDFSAESDDMDEKIKAMNTAGAKIMEEIEDAGADADAGFEKKKAALKNTAEDLTKGINAEREKTMKEIESVRDQTLGDLETIQQTAEEKINSKLSQIEKEKNSTTDTLRKMMETMEAIQKSIDDLTQAHKDMKARVEHMEFEMFKTGGEEA